MRPVFLPQRGYGIYTSRYVSNFPFFLTMAGSSPAMAKSKPFGQEKPDIQPTALIWARGV
jgi:hypothetical protein